MMKRHLFFVIFSYAWGYIYCRPPIQNLGMDCGYSSCPVGDPGMINVHLVSHTHNDVGWLKTPDEYFYGDKSYVQIAGVQYILDSVIEELEKDSSKRFIYVETSFFYRWWNSRDASIHKKVQNLVQRGRLEFVSGGWSMNDEASNYYEDTIDQMTWGLRFLNDTFGVCGTPRVGWQIDPFGHSREHTSMLAQMGFDGLFLGRIDYADKDKRQDTKTLEFVWNASANLGANGQLFTGVLPNTYSPPPGFCFDILCSDPPIQDNPNLKGYNVNERVDSFLALVYKQANSYATNHLVMTMGNDFTYQNAHTWFYNLDKLIQYVNARQTSGSNVNVFYSTPSCYLQALNKAGKNWTVKTDDFFPYASDPHAYWTGYFTSRPAFKGYTKITNNILQIGKQVSVLANVDTEDNLSVLRRYQGDAQHHDAITGTAKQVVDHDYTESLAIGETNAEDAINIAYAKLLPMGSTNAPVQHFCRYLNVSYCDATENQEAFVVTIYNRLAHEVSSPIRVPVTLASYTVSDPFGNPIENQIVPIPDQVMKNPEKLGRARNDLVFSADLPPAGFSSYFVKLQPKENKLTKSKFRSKLISIQQPKILEDLTIQNEFLRVTVDGVRGLLKEITDLKTKKSYKVQQQFYYYNAMSGDNSIPEYRASGAYILRPNGTEASPVSDAAITTLITGKIVQEIHQTFNDHVSQVIRLNAGQPAVELEWLVGPINVGDGIGREVISRFQTDFNSAGLFYTDANGREILERRRDYRPTWTLNITEPISGNYYPVNSKIFIQDVNQDAQLTIVTDRSQGGSSLRDGEIEIMLHRRLLYDDAFGVDEALNETGVDGLGLRVRGKHIVLVGSIAEAPSAYRIASQRINSPPLLSFAPLPTATSHQAANSILEWQANFKTLYSGLRRPLPDNVHLLTMEPWKDGAILIRLEHFFEKAEDPNLSKPVTVNLQDIFADFRITSAAETSLGANRWLTQVNRMTWDTEDNSTGSLKAWQNSPIIREIGKSMEVTLNPMEIRTFVLQIVST